MVSKLMAMDLLVHPHACGEYDNQGNPVGDILGSSPRLWGIPTQRHHRTRMTRFIPTPVGNTVNALLCPITNPVHPHACGEYRYGADMDNLYDGSSPRLWGILL